MIEAGHFAELEHILRLTLRKSRSIVLFAIITAIDRVLCIART